MKRKRLDKGTEDKLVEEGLCDLDQEVCKDDEEMCLLERTIMGDA